MNNLIVEDNNCGIMKTLSSDVRIWSKQEKKKLSRAEFLSAILQHRLMCASHSAAISEVVATSDISNSCKQFTVDCLI